MNRPIADVAKGMSQVAAQQEWFAVYAPPISAQGPQVDQMVAIFRDIDEAYTYLNNVRHPSGWYMEPLSLLDRPIPVYVPTKSSQEAQKADKNVP